MERKIFFLAGLSNGDEGKGTMVDWLSSTYPIKSIWRYNGGAQAAHHVIAENGTLHCFAQFGSGTLSAPVNTYLSRFVAINPISLVDEYQVLQSKINFPLPIIYLAADALVITPYHSLVNQMREISRGVKRFGSCGRGVGETIRDAKCYPNEVLRVKDLSDLDRLKYKLRFLQAMKIDEAEQLYDAQNTNQELRQRLEKLRSDDHFKKLINWYTDFSQRLDIKVVNSTTEIKPIEADGDIVFEGAQGALLHRDYGLYPHITQSDTSFRNAEELIKEYGLNGKIVKIGVLRAYATRHGAGPLVTFDSKLTKLIPDEHNVGNDWQGDFRIGWLDLVATNYALEIMGKVDGIALTNLDRLAKLKIVKICYAYQYSGSADFSEIDKHFICSSGTNSRLIIHGIKLPKVHLSNRIERQRITDIINDCQPMYKTLRVGADFIDTYVKYLEWQLNTKIIVTSTGPKASDKRLLNP